MNTRQVTAHWVVEFQDVINDTEFTTVGIVVRKTDIGHVIARGKEGVVSEQYKGDFLNINQVNS